MRLTSVEKGSPAWDAGFVPDDIIVALDGRQADKDRFDAAIAEHKAGDLVTVAYFRHDKLSEKKVRLGSSREAGTSFTLHLPRHPAAGPLQPILDEEHVEKM